MASRASASPRSAARSCARSRRRFDEFGDLITGDDPLRTEQVTAKLRAASAPCGPGGIAALAISAIDIALWDIRGKAFGVSLARLLGGLRDRVPTYASGALMRTTPTDKLERAAAALVEKGYSQVKTQMAVEGLTPRRRSNASGWSATPSAPRPT